MCINLNIMYKLETIYLNRCDIDERSFVANTLNLTCKNLPLLPKFVENLNHLQNLVCENCELVTSLPFQFDTCNINIIDCPNLRLK